MPETIVQTDIVQSIYRRRPTVENIYHLFNKLNITLKIERTSKNTGYFCPQAFNVLHSQTSFFILHFGNDGFHLEAKQQKR